MGLSTQILANNQNLPNDSKLLDGWVADVAQTKDPSSLIGTTVATPPGIDPAKATPLADLQGTYTVVQVFGSANGSGNGYFGVELQDANGNYILVNRQYRLTTGSGSDIATDTLNVAADEVGISTAAIDDAEKYAAQVAQQAATSGGAVTFIGQSEGGMFAQLQQAYLQSGSSGLTTLPQSMSLTINAVPTDSVIANTMPGFTASEVNGLNISAVDDMFTGPHSIAQNTTGTQLYVSSNSNGTFQGSTSSSGSFLGAIYDNIAAVLTGEPNPHFLGYFGTGNTGNTANGGQNIDLNAMVSVNLPSLASAPAQATNDKFTIDQSTANSVVVTDNTTCNEYLINQSATGSAGGDVVAGGTGGTYSLQSLIVGAPLFTLTGVTSQPTIDATTGNLTVSTAAGTFNLTSGGSVVNAGATATINGQTVTLLGTGGSSPFALISHDNTGSDASASSSIVLAYPQRPVAQAAVRSYQRRVGSLRISHDRGSARTDRGARLWGFIGRESGRGSDRRRRIGVRGLSSAQKAGRLAGAKSHSGRTRIANSVSAMSGAHTQWLPGRIGPVTMSSNHDRTTHEYVHDVSLGLGGLG